MSWAYVLPGKTQKLLLRHMAALPCFPRQTGAQYSPLGMGRLEDEVWEQRLAQEDGLSGMEECLLMCQSSFLFLLACLRLGGFLSLRRLQPDHGPPGSDKQLPARQPASRHAVLFSLREEAAAARDENRPHVPCPSQTGGAREGSSSSFSGCLAFRAASETFLWKWKGLA